MDCCQITMGCNKIINIKYKDNENTFYSFLVRVCSNFEARALITLGLSSTAILISSVLSDGTFIFKNFFRLLNSDS